MKRRMWTWLLILVLALGLLSGCGGYKMESAAAEPMEAPMAVETPMAVEEAMDMGYGGAAEKEMSAAGTTAGTKRIYTANLDLETTEFDTAVEEIAALTERSGGWFESSSLSSRGSGYRYADYTVRVPVEQYRAFLSGAGELCHLLYKDEYVEDVSQVYYDTAGRLKTQQIKLERLQALLEKAEVMEDIITIESAISETEQRIDDLSGTLQHYDAKVDYATVYVSLREVGRLSNVEEPATGFGAQLAAAFSSGWKHFVSGIQDLTIALAYGWMWVLAAVALVVLAVRALKKKKPALPKLRRKEDPKKEDPQE